MAVKESNYEYSIREVADLMGVSVETVRKIEHAAMAKIASTLFERGMI